MTEPGRKARLLAELPNVAGDTVQGLRGMGERGSLDQWAKHYKLKRHGFDLPDDWRCMNPDRIRDWKVARESDVDLRVRVAAAIEEQET